MNNMLVVAEMLAELARTEKAANIKRDPDIDVFMKVRNSCRKYEDRYYLAWLF